MVGGISLFEFIILLNENVIMEINFVSFFSCQWSPINSRLRLTCAACRFESHCYIDLRDPIFGCKILQEIFIEVGLQLPRGITKVREDKISRQRKIIRNT